MIGHFSPASITFEEYQRKCDTLRQTAIENIGFESEADLARVAKVNQSDITRLMKGQYTKGISTKLGVSLSIAIKRSHTGSAIKIEDAADVLIDNLYHLWRHNLMWYDKVDTNAVPSNCKVKITSALTEKFAHKERSTIIQIWRTKYITDLKKYSMGNKSSYSFPRRFETYEKKKEYIKEKLIDAWLMPLVFDQYNQAETAVKNDLKVIIDFFNEAIESNYYSDVEEFFWNISCSLYLCGAVEPVRTVSEWLVVDASNHISVSTYYFAKACQIWINSSSEIFINIYKSHNQISEIWNELARNDLIKELDPRVVAMVCELVLRIQNRLFIAENTNYSCHSFHVLYEQTNRMLTSVLEDKNREPISDDVVERFKIPLDYQLALNFCIRGSRENSDRLLNMALEVYDDLFKRSTEIGWQRLSHATLTWKAAIVAKGSPEVSRAMLTDETVLIVRRDPIREKILKGIEDGHFFLF